MKTATILMLLAVVYFAFVADQVNGRTTGNHLRRIFREAYVRKYIDRINKSVEIYSIIAKLYSYKDNQQ